MNEKQAVSMPIVAGIVVAALAIIGFLVYRGMSGPAPQSASSVATKPKIPPAGTRPSNPQEAFNMYGVKGATIGGGARPSGYGGQGGYRPPTGP